MYAICIILEKPGLLREVSYVEGTGLYVSAFGCLVLAAMTFETFLLLELKYKDGLSRAIFGFGIKSLERNF